MAIVNDHSLTFFPVGNGDSTLIRLADGTSILVDLNARGCDGEDADSNDETYDVRAHLLDVLPRDDGDRPRLDAFILTHADQDHLRGTCRVFYLGDPAEYAKADAKHGRILIDEIWFAPRLFSRHDQELSEDAKALRDEAERRLALYQNDSPRAHAPGNRLRLVGYTGNEELECIEHLCVGAGQTTSCVNDHVKSDFSIFVHAPFRAESDGEDSDRNDTSVVMQLSFKVGDDPRASLVILAGDASSDVLERVIKRSEKQSLEWDLLLAPHHCSWTFFAPRIEDEPSRLVLDFLEERRRAGAFVVSSSKPINDDDDNPPCFKAAQRYRAVVSSKNFYCTGEEPSEECPEPLIFRMTTQGPIRTRAPQTSAIRTTAGRVAVSTPKTYG